MNTFDKDIVRGGIGEACVRDWFHQQGAEVYDESQNKRYQEEDVDFLVLYKGRRFKVEVKTDYKASETGNLPIEYDTGGTAGWFLKTEADLFFFVVIENDSVKNIYCITNNTLRKFIAERHKSLRAVGMGDSRESGYRGEGYLIPINTIYCGKELFTKVK